MDKEDFLMIKFKVWLEQFRSLRQAEKLTGVPIGKIIRWRDHDAMIDADGNVWVKKGVAKR